jgi:hypothetical protein
MSMFSLSAARVLDSRANETNYKSLINQLTGLRIGEQEADVHTTSRNQAPQAEVLPDANPQIASMGSLGTLFIIFF